MSHYDDCIAVVGLACRFPGDSNDAESFWRILEEGRNVVTEVPSDRYEPEGFFHPDPQRGGSTYVRKGHFMSGNIRAFDNPFFNITPQDAQCMDPQQRLVLENVYHALENAGILLDQIAGSPTSVFVGGGFGQDYLKAVTADPELLAKSKGLGTSTCMLANRVSWFYDLHGASLTLDTACSSSLVAIHAACQSLRTGESPLAIASGVCVVEHPSTTMALGDLGVLSPDGRCYSFDHRANGYGRGEGVGSLILKSLKAALRDGNKIRAVIRATGSNQDGRTPGIAMPSEEAQLKLIQDVYARWGLDAGATRYVEAHGTGTSTGDPLEARAIARAFKSNERDTPLYIGSVKGNIGHLEGAAGIAGVIKAILMVEHGTIPPAPDFQKVNPRIPLHDWKISIATSLTPWAMHEKRRISVNSFGFGGSNAHAVIDDADSVLAALQQDRETPQNGLKQTHADEFMDGQANGHANGVNGVNGVNHHDNGHVNQNDTDANGFNGKRDGISDISPAIRKIEHFKREGSLQKRIFVLSALDEAGLGRLAKALSEHLSMSVKAPQEEDDYLRDLSFTLSNARTQFPWKLFCVADSRATLQQDLTPPVEQTIRTVDRVTKLGFVFTGQGAQWALMGRSLLTYPIYSQSIQAADGYLQSIGSNWSLMDQLCNPDADMNDPLLSQTACTAVQVALVDLLGSWNIKPQRVVGHSSGEIAAAYCAGYITQADAWKIAYFRGQVCRDGTDHRGAMLAVGMSSQDAQGYLDDFHALHRDRGSVRIACFNSHRNVTISGDADAIDTLHEELTQIKVFARKLAVTQAYHSHYMEELAEKYLSLIGSLSQTTASGSEGGSPVEMFSSLTGTAVRREDVASGHYWTQNLVSPVRFEDALRAMVARSETKKILQLSSKESQFGITDLVEIGPHPALRSAIKDTTTTIGSGATINYLSTLRRGDNDGTGIIESAARLFCFGYHVSLDAINNVKGDSLGVKSNLLVNLPPYVFNHDKEHYIESRLSKAYRYRQLPRHDLCGVMASDGNASETRWRGFLRVSELPWLKDHTVTGKVVFPAVGYLTMAIEAVQQLKEPNRSSTGISFKDVEFKSALIVPETPEGIEYSLSMADVPFSKKERSSRWRDFRVFSYNVSTDHWTENCCGSVQLDYAHEVVSDVDGYHEQTEAFLDDTERFAEAEQLCRDSMHPGLTYTTWSKMGLLWGPTFRNIKESRMGDGSGMALCKVIIPDVATVMPKNFLQPHTIQPALFDSVLATFFSALLDRNRERLYQPQLPASLESAWISTSTPTKPGTALDCLATAKDLGFDQSVSTVVARDSSQGKTIIVIKNLTCKQLVTSPSKKDDTEHICRMFEWQPQLSLLKKGSDIFHQALGAPSSSDDTVRSHRRSQLLAILYFNDAIQQLGAVDPKSIADHHQHYVEWMRHQISLAEKGELVNLDTEELKMIRRDPEVKRKLIESTEGISAQERLLRRCGSRIYDVITGKADVLDLMFGQDNLMDDVYAETLGNGDGQPLFQLFLEALGHNCTNLNVLEFGAGTGSTTITVLNSLSPRQPAESVNDRITSRIAQYTFTDISAAFLERGKERFKSWGNLLDFRVLDVEKDPESQGFLPGSYDIIVASAVIHATVDPLQSLRYARKLLKCGGKLILVEPVYTDLLRRGSCFGLLPGWWLSYDVNLRPWGALMTEVQWDAQLIKAGFSGNDLIFRDYEGVDAHELSYLVSTAVEPEAEGPNSVNGAAKENATYIICSNSQLSTPLVASVSAAVSTDAYCQLVPYQDVAGLDMKNGLCISLLALADFDPSNMNETLFSSIQSILLKANNLIWITRDQASDPKASMMLGLIRSARWEREVDQPNLVSLEIHDWSGTHSQVIVDAVLRILAVFNPLQQSYERNGEYLFRGGELWSARLVESVSTTNLLDRANDIVEPSAQPFDTGKTRGLVLTQTQPGMLNKMVFVDDHSWQRELEPMEVELKIEAAGLNMRDVLIAMGSIPTTNFGLEGAGTVTRTGSRVTTVAVGDRVATLVTKHNTGFLRTVCYADERTVVHVPEKLEMTKAAAMPIVFITALHALQTIARLSPGESVLIHSAAGGTGQAAIQVAKLAGAVIYATVSTKAKRDLLVRQYGLNPEHIFSSRGLEFVDSINRLTNRQGVDVILNSLSGESLRATWSCIAPHGRFLELGQRDIRSNANLPMQPFLENVMYYGVNVVHLALHKPDMVVSYLRQIFELASKGTIQVPEPITVYGYGQLEKAFRHMQAGQNVGKSVFAAQGDDIVMVMPPKQPVYKFRADSTYVLAGGLSGIGKSLAQWMVSRGARNFISLSRSGEANAGVAAFATLMREHSCRVKVFACDVSDRSQVAAVLTECEESMPRIRGCIQGAMQLSDKLLTNMTLDHYTTAIWPKVQGTWNLHELLDPDLDFFIMLSSVASVLGSRGQANYAAGNAYQDALAKHLTSRGIRKAVSINLGSIEDVGYIAEKLDEAHRAQVNSWDSIPELTMHRIVEFAIDPRSDAIGKGMYQCVTGLMTPSRIIEKGMPMPAVLNYPLFTQLHSNSDASQPECQGTAGGSAFPVQQLLRDCDSADSAASIVQEAIQRKVANMMSMPWEDVHPSKPLHTYGVDSLVAVELRAWSSKILRSDIQVLDILGQTTIADLSLTITAGMRPVV